MNAEIFAEWLRRQGHKVIRTKSSFWFDAGPGVFQAFPYHQLITPTRGEINRLMLEHGMVALRYSTALDSAAGMVSYHIVIQKPYELSMLKSQARNGVKCGMKHFKIEQISFERLATEGWTLQQDTLRRQGRLRSMKQEEWERLCRSAADLQGFEAWSATSNGELAAAIIIFRIDDLFYVPYALSHTRFLSDHPNNALFYTVSSELLEREGVSGIFFTVQSLDAPSNVDEFKIRMGFKAKVVCQRVDFSPFLRPFATSTIHASIRKLLRRYPLNPALAKAEGILRFHLEGKRPINEQTWPECLASEKSQILTSMGHHIPEKETFKILEKIRSPFNKDEAQQSPQEETLQITFATQADVDELVELHMKCFSKFDHLAVQFGKKFIYAVFRWFVSSPGTYVLVARNANSLIGFTAISDRPYNIPMLRACKWEAILGMIKAPSSAFHPELIDRLFRYIFFKRDDNKNDSTASIAFTGVDPEWQGCGVGTILKNVSLQVCRERGMKSIVTGVRRLNARAKRMNESAGFVEVATLSTKHLIHLKLDL